MGEAPARYPGFHGVPARAASKGWPASTRGIRPIRGFIAALPMNATDTKTSKADRSVNRNQYISIRPYNSKHYAFCCRYSLTSASRFSPCARPSRYTLSSASGSFSVREMPRPDSGRMTSSVPAASRSSIWRICPL